MPNIAIPYVTGPGPTRRLAEEIATALGQADCNARLIDIEVMFRIDWDALEASDAIVLGTPAAMGSTAAAFKSFMEDTADIAAGQGWADKIAAGFTVAPASAAQATLAQLAGFAAQHGMVWVGRDPAVDLTAVPDLPDVWQGLAVLDPPGLSRLTEADLHAARAFGTRIARAARRWSL